MGPTFGLAHHLRKANQQGTAHQTDQAHHCPACGQFWKYSLVAKTYPDGSSLSSLCCTLVFAIRLQNGQSTHFETLCSCLRGVTIAGPGEGSISSAAFIGNAPTAEVGLVIISFAFVWRSILTFLCLNLEHLRGLYSRLTRVGLLLGPHLWAGLLVMGRLLRAAGLSPLILLKVIEE